MERNSFINSKEENFSVLELVKNNSKLNFLFFHATGFNGLTYKSLLESLFNNSLQDLNVRAIDLRGHGMTKAEDDPKILSSWSIYVEDSLEWMNSLDGDFIVAGHSMGAIVASRLAVALPQRVKMLVMLEPVLFSPFNSLKFRVMSKLGLSRSTDMINAASKRRHVFSNRQEILDSYEGRGAFKTWQLSWIENYVVGGSIQDEEGKTLLSCHPSWESKTFSTSAMDNWKFLRNICRPCYVATGGINSTCSNSSRKALKNLGSNWDLEHFADATHFLPMEKTETLIDRINQFMSK
tara:strand:+ start:3662 stop:4543 length:882 start_codon:yes stop_codon:yes gene_type:complete